MTRLIFAILIFSLTVQAEESEMLPLIEKKINFSIEEKAQLSAEKAEIQRQIEELKNKIKERKKIIAARLKAQSRLKNFQWGELLLNNNLNNLNRDLKILKNLNQYDFEIFKEYRLSLQMLAEARKNLAQTEEQIQRNIEVLHSQQNEIRKLEDIRYEFLQNERRDSFLLHRGKLTRPLDGTPRQEFGSLLDQVRQYYLINYGELYNVNKVLPVKAVGPGVVIFRDLLGRWRETLIVQHSDNYYSVYAGVKNPKVKTGDKVLAQEILGSSQAPEFYFELRHYANPINPKKWFKE